MGCLPFTVPITLLGQHVSPAAALQMAATSSGKKRGWMHRAHGRDISTGEEKCSEEHELQRRVLAASEKLATPAAAAMPALCSLMEELQGLASRCAQADEMLVQ